MSRLMRRVKALAKRHAPGFVIKVVSPPDGATEEQFQGILRDAAKGCEPDNVIVVIDWFPEPAREPKP